MNGRPIRIKDVLLYNGAIYKPYSLAGLQYTYLTGDGEVVYCLINTKPLVENYIYCKEVMVLDKEEYPEWYI